MAIQKKSTATSAKKKTEVTDLKAKLKKAMAEISKLKKTAKAFTAKEVANAKKKMEEIFNKGYQEAMTDMQKAEDAFDKHMAKAQMEFEKKILPKLGKRTGVKTRKAKTKKSSNK